MSNLTSTQAGAFDALLGLLQVAGAAQSPPVQVLDSVVLQYEPAAYVILEAIEQHEFDIAALGSYAFEETYELCGCTTYAQGDIDYRSVRDKTFSIHEAVVQATVVTNRGANQTPVLGSNAPSTLVWIVPVWQRYSAAPANFSGGAAGVAGTIEWRYQVKARITTA